MPLPLIVCRRLDEEGYLKVFQFLAKSFSCSHQQSGSQEATHRTGPIKCPQWSAARPFIKASESKCLHSTSHYISHLGSVIISFYHFEKLDSSLASPVFEVDNYPFSRPCTVLTRQTSVCFSRISLHVCVSPSLLSIPDVMLLTFLPPLHIVLFLSTFDTPTCCFYFEWSLNSLPLLYFSFILFIGSFIYWF